MAAPVTEPSDRFVFIYDRRTSDAPEVKVSIDGVNHFNGFKDRLKEVLQVSETDEFVIATTNREEVKDDESFDFIEKGETLYLLTDINQELSAAANERVEYLPHYDTIVKGGMYEYYASEGQNPLPYAFAELIDNSLAATALNDGKRTIEMRLMLDDSAVSKNCIMFIDNGKGMTSRQLNNWAIYRLSKFTRRDRANKGIGGDANNSFNLAETWAPRFMNSDISYFGVGGKQAIFFIGNSARMITKPKSSKDVHELMISKDEFERREKNKQSIYTGFIRNRKPGDVSHIPAEDEFLVNLLKEEESRDCFTAVVIQGVNQQHLSFLKHNFKMWTRQLAHIYHFYLHGPEGNQTLDKKTDSNPFNNIDIQVSVHTRGNPNPRHINLRNIEDDMQSQYTQSGVSCFDFKAHVDGMTAVEGIIRYHPFLYDRETYPVDPYGPRLEPEPTDDHGYAINDRPARGRRPIFETFWNGRLIPYTLINQFDWCTLPKKQKNVPEECYNRISGVLWTNDSFKVSTNKLTFLDLEVKLKEKTTNFVRMVNGHEKRTQIEREFQTWLKDCSEVFDKQIMFTHCQGVVRRPDQSKYRQYPWTKYKTVEWDGKEYKAGDLVRILRTLPVLHGTIKAFYLHGELEDNAFGMGGDIEIAQEPRSIYTEVKFVPLNKLDRGASNGQVKKYIEDEEAKLPDHLILHWPNGNEIKPNDKVHAGIVIGDMKVEICNKKGEKISKMPGSAAGIKKLLVELKLIWHAPSGDETVVSLLSQHGKTWPYWFKKMSGTAKQLGSYTLQFQAVLNESGAVMYAGRVLPSYTIKFTIMESDPVRFLVGMLDGPFKVGVPFQIPLEFQDEYYNATQPPSKLKPILDADGLELCYETTHTKGLSCFIRGVVAKGIIDTSAGKNFNLKVSVSDMPTPQILKIRLLPGPPAVIHVQPDEEIELENGSVPTFSVQMHDVAGNITSGNKMTVQCKLSGASGLPNFVCDCSGSGRGQLMGKPIQLKKMKGETIITAAFSLQGMSHVPAVERIIKVMPSTAASVLKVFYKNGDSEVEIVPKSTIQRVAGSMFDGLSFRVFNEAGSEIEMDDKMAAKIKANWSIKVSKEMARKNCLPPIKVPLLVSEVKYAQVSVAEAGWVEVPFNVKALAGEATMMEYVVQGEITAFKGEAVKGSILLSLKDRHGNPVMCTLQEWQNVVLECSSLKTENMKIQLKSSSCCLSNLMFDSPGNKQVVITFRHLECCVGGFHITSGPPIQLEVMEWTGQTSTAHSDRPLLQPFRVKLLDADGEDSNTADVKIHIAKDAELKLHPMPGFLLTDSRGIADFGVLTPSASSGKYELQPKAIYGKAAVINGPKLILYIQPDPHKANALKVSYNNKTAVIAGHTLPDLTVEIMAEDGSIMNTVDVKHIKMSLSKSVGSTIKEQPVEIEGKVPTATSLRPGVFSFKKCPAPKESGLYRVMVMYDDGFQKLTEDKVVIQVNPSSPSVLVAVGVQCTPTVSNTKSIVRRTLLKNLCLELRDDYNNSLRDGFSGKVRVELVPPSKMEEVPVFVGGTSEMEIPLVNGRCILLNLILQEDCPGKDGMEYQLKCTVLCDSIPKNKPLTPLELSFLFYNDAKKQQQMTALVRERDSLQSTVLAFQSMFDTQKQLISEFRVAVHNAQKSEQALRADLRKQNIPSNHLQSVETVEKLIAARTKDREALLAKPRRACSLQPVEEDPQVLGKIAHLALVHQDDIATVLSWHMSADMDCIITLSTQKAKEIYSKTQGKQQVLPLDSIYRKNLPDWQKPLPHVRFKPGLKPSGNPVYARNLLEFTKDEESCRIVFGMLLGDTLILDNLDHANVYRQEIVKHTHCPTILTRSGDRIRSNGKFGGAMNRAPPVEKLKGSVFGQPLPLAYHAVCTQIETLSQYQQALSTHIQTQDELQDQINQQKNPDTMNKYRECKETENRLKEVEKKLGMATPTPTRVSKLQYRTPPVTSSISADQDTPTLGTKRPKLEPGVSPPQSPSVAISPGRKRQVEVASISSPIFDPSATPSRTSLRIASMTTVVADDGRKKLRKTN